MPRLSETEKQEILRFLEADKPLPEKYRFLLFDDKREIILECRKKRITKVDLLGFEFAMGLFPNVLDEARAKGIDIAPKYIPAEVFDKRADRGNRSAPRRIARWLTSIYHECQPGRRKIAVKVVDIFGNDTMTIVEVSVGKK